MKLNKIVPIVTTENIDQVKEFYTRYFGFSISFEMEGNHLGITSGENDEFEISFMAPGEENQPTFTGQGLTYCFEVDNVDAEYNRIGKEDIEILQPLQDNPWGDRSFIISDPAGISIYIYQLIPPIEEFKKYFKR